jgi:hypothetical protein
MQTTYLLQAAKTKEESLARAVQVVEADKQLESLPERGPATVRLE